MLIVFSYGIASAITTALLGSIPSKSFRFRFVLTSLTLLLGISAAWITDTVANRTLYPVVTHDDELAYETIMWQLNLIACLQLVVLLVMVGVAWSIREFLLVPRMHQIFKQDE